MPTSIYYTFHPRQTSVYVWRKYKLLFSFKTMEISSIIAKELEKSLEYNAKGNPRIKVPPKHERKAQGILPYSN
jgi:hypothetical protein